MEFERRYNQPHGRQLPEKNQEPALMTLFVFFGGAGKLREAANKLQSMLYAQLLPHPTNSH